MGGDQRGIFTLVRSLRFSSHTEIAPPLFFPPAFLSISSMRKRNPKDVLKRESSFPPVRLLLKNPVFVPKQTEV